MKSIYLMILCAVCLLYSKTAVAYGNDVIINNQPGITHSEVDIDLAFNGWIYAAYSFVDGTEGGIHIRRSKDDGQTWQTLDSYTVTNVRYPAFDITVAGTDTNNLKVFVTGVNHNINTGAYLVFIDKYNGATGAFDESLLLHQTGTRKIYDVASATDYRFPANNTSPYSIAFAYSCDGAVVDSLNYMVSTDGGTTLQTSKSVATTSKRMGKISISYGRSAAASNGRYFLAWEEFDSPTATTGHIYTTRNASTVTGSFIGAVNLDSVSSAMINLCRNPRIATSYGADDNDSASVTAVVLVDRDFTSDGSDFDVLGFYNKRSHFTNYWYRLDIDNDGSSDMQPDISFDPVNKNFLATYLDSTNGRIPYLVNEVNLLAPSIGWGTVSTAYNDANTNLKKAFPKVVINPARTQVAHAWIQEDGTGNGISLFDAEYRQFAVTNLSETTCVNEPFTFNGQVLDTSGVYRDTITTPNGDSVVILTLTVNALETRTLTASICAGDVFTFNGQNLSTPGIYFDTISAGVGCDTIVTLNLTVNIVVTPTINQAGAGLNTQAYTTYQWKLNGGDIPLANSQSYTATENGIYTVEVTDASGCSATSAAVTVTGVGISTIQEAGINVYPNPVTDVLNVELTGNENANLRIVDVAGSVVMEKTISGKEMLNIQHLAKGVYMLQITQAGKVSSAKITKQ